MTDRAQQELALLKRQWPDLEWTEASDGRCWVRLRTYPVPSGWNSDTTEICFAIPNEAATPPYGFYVPRTLMIEHSATQVAPTSHYTPEATGVPDEFGDGWAMFSWSPTTAWRPQDAIERGDNLLHFVKSFGDRLEDPS
jgi:hypothetical protein